jgi:hypothetical protein
MKKRQFIRLALVALIMVPLNASCGKKEEVAPTPTETGAPTAVYQPTGDEGTLTGKVAFQGTAPARKKIDMSNEAACAAKHAGGAFFEDVVVNDGTLQNVFVYVKSGLGDKGFAPPSAPVELDQNGCLYVPHVLGLMAGQNLVVKNTDPTNHNIHPTPKNNREWNESQPPGGAPITKTFPREEVMIPVKCNQHPWMKSYIGVLKHPFHAVSGKDGTFEIKGLPPGSYEIEAWHETYGAQTAQVTVGAKETKAVEFTFNAEQAYGLGSLRVMPALVLPMASGSCCGSSHNGH